MHPLRIRRRHNLLREIFAPIRAQATQLYLPPDNGSAEWLIVAIHLHATVIEMTAAFIRLFETSCYSGMPAVLRVSYEALAEQRALFLNHDYVHNMAAASVHEGKAIPEKLRKHHMEVLQTFPAEEDFRPFLRSLRDRADEIDAQGGKRIEPEHKFNAANMPKDYLLYRQLSAPVHNDLGDLQARHGRPQPDRPTKVLLFRPVEDYSDQNNIIEMLEIAAWNLLRTCEPFHGPKSDFYGRLNTLRERVRQVLTEDIASE